MPNNRQRPVDPVTNTDYIENSLKVDSPEMKTIQAYAKSNNIAVSLGFSERSDSHSLYISQVLITPQGDIAMHRRKVKPTHMERTVFGDGSKEDLNNVAEVDFGGNIGVVRVGSLACWEHTQPLLKYHTYTQREEIHISAWPPMYVVFIIFFRSLFLLHNHVQLVFWNMLGYTQMRSFSVMSCNDCY